MKIAVAQINSIIGDLENNKNKILNYYNKGVEQGADLVVFPELALIGYPPLDLVEKKEFRERAAAIHQEIALAAGKTGLLFGSITDSNEKVGTNIYNSAILCHDGKIQFIQNKSLIPNYDVFDEVRYFEPSKLTNVYKFNGEVLGISVCEDIWNDEDYWNNRRYLEDPVKNQIEMGATLLINISASPFSVGKRELKRKMLSVLTKGNNIPLVYASYVAAQTELIFDGASMCFNNSGDLVKLGNAYEEDFFIFDTDEKYNTINKAENCFEEEVLSALIFGVKDYCNKLNFKKVLVGLSGGMDSAMVTYIAVKALGKENVHTVLMPSKYSSKGSIDDSIALVNNLDISHNVISIEPVFDNLTAQLADAFNHLPEDITEENLQARIRGIYLMALSNKHKYLLLSTGNKSEMATGYSTMYGDMCGGLAVIADVYKSDIYRLAGFINKEEKIIPQEIIDKAPSAELRPNQTDQDSLPPYDLLDRILKMYLEQNKEYNEISKVIGDAPLVNRVLRLVDINEFKRKQSAPVLRVSSKAFGYGRRYPIVQGWRK
ncbi:MAG: NAD+ synthase [Bacteroidota bacterium]|nr:NAD+ synthase [Bacteroidota bacterium]